MDETIQKLFDLSGKVALVTGGARDLGFDAATILAAAGCHVALTSRTLDHDQPAAASFPHSLGLAMDQRHYAEVKETVDRVMKWKGRIDILINNAGGNYGAGAARLLERDPDDIAGLIELNLTGMLYCCREAGRAMAAQGSGKIVNIASIAGEVGRDRRMYDRS